MGNTQNLDWLFENVLFLDHTMPPFTTWRNSTDTTSYVSGPNGSERRNEKGNEEANTSGNKGVKRVAPRDLNLRTQIFRVVIDLDGCSSEFQLKCLRDPLVFALCDKEGNTIRSIPCSYLRGVDKYKETVTCKFDSKPPSNQNKMSPGSYSSEGFNIKFIFLKGEEDAENFCQTVRLLYGVTVTILGVSKSDRSHSPDKQPSLNVFPLHDDNTINDEFQMDSDAGDGSEVIPITIVGKLSSGSIVRWKNIDTSKKWCKPKLVEWRIPAVPGRIDDFVTPSSNKNLNVSIISSETLTVTSDMAGKYIQVKTTRMINPGSHKSRVIESVATKGPVTLSDQEAREVLEIVTALDFCVSVETDVKSFLRFFPDPKIQKSLKEAHVSSLILSLGLTTQGLTLSSSDFDETLCLSFPWNTFYVTRLKPEAGQYDEEVYLHLYFLKYDLKRGEEKKAVTRLVFPSEKSRNSVYNAIFFFKLQKTFKHFDRWGVDLAAGNYSVFQNRYAKLWSTTDFYQDVVNSLVPLTRDNDTQPLPENDQD